MGHSTLFKLMGAAGMAIALAACETQTTSSEPESPASVASAAEPMTMADSINEDQAASYGTGVEHIFAQGLDLYNKGRYPAAIRKFRSPKLAQAWPELHVRALKYLAFSYCLTNKPRQCQKAFEDAMQIDSKFDLKPLEKNHPMWGPVFQQARSDFDNKMGNNTHAVSATAASTPEQADKTANNPTHPASSASQAEQSQAAAPSGGGSVPQAEDTQDN